MHQSRYRNNFDCSINYPKSVYVLDFINKHLFVILNNIRVINHQSDFKVILYLGFQTQFLT
jgi:hypothetical protein